MTDKHNINPNPIFQALLEKDPLTYAEVREMAVRHVLSNHMNNSPVVTAQLIDIMRDLLAKDVLSAGPLYVTGDDAIALLKEHFVAGMLTILIEMQSQEAEALFLWPRAIPKASVTYFPRDFIIQVGSGLGVKVANFLKNRGSD